MYYKYLKKNHLYKFFIMAAIVTFFTMASRLIMPMSNQLLIDEALLDKNTDSLTKAVCIFLGAMISMTILENIKQYFLAVGENNWAAELRLSMHKFYRENYISYNDENRGELLSKYTQDVECLKDKLRHIINIAVDAIQLLVIIILFFIVNVKMGMIVLICMPLYFILPIFVGKVIKKKSDKVQNQKGILMRELNESFRISKDIRINNKNNWDISNLGNVFYGLVKPIVSLEVWKTSMLYTSILYFIVNAVFLVVGGNMVIAGELTPGYLIAMVTYINFMNAPVSNMMNNFALYKECMGADKRINEFLNIQKFEDGTNIFDYSKPFDILLQDVSLQKENKHILKNINLAINSGSFIFLTGKSGAGKSSLAKILSRLVNPTDGRIYIQNKEYSNYSMEHFYEAVSIVQIENELPNLSIKENLFFHLSKKEINKIHIDDYKEIMNLLKIPEFITNFENGLDTIVFSNKLSTGQKQRINLFRAIVKNSPILILDEATSGLEFELEKEIYEYLKEHRKNLITIIITHRINLITPKDLVININNGVIENENEYERGRKNG
ncbi:ABC transporter ATP-binding protein [Bacillus cereus group sp. Bce001]|uniref:ABC transporter ATP-binding protein n=1 Tax=Bacillus cereus group sp. Bce001 TaxID=3445260 RepID=UPI0032FAF245|nr:ABC transporter ATP-binding protein [Bacillus cereus]HDR4628919.1 ABC transporter ATP-binding protein [Bacillus cereus]HDR4663665.1 ABC transporter ATP-binding protein [Bacillus cereus]HDR4930809.1 ABC transporter ATP-binding protein [Bacillus cereus]HDR4936523.1 ABC transporter ATP-binding protein [Bacillus cereus]